MKYLTCYYDQTKPGSPWDEAIEKALAEYSEQERRKIQVLCLPENMRKQPRKDKR